MNILKYLKPYVILVPQACTFSRLLLVFFLLAPHVFSWRHSIDILEHG